jgi:hypothetical protein
VLNWQKQSRDRITPRRPRQGLKYALQKRKPIGEPSTSLSDEAAVENQLYVLAAR